MTAIDGDHLKRWIISRGLKSQLHPADIIDQIDRESTIEPQRKKGRWLPDNNSPYEMRFVCSECKTSEVVPTIGFTKYEPIWDFCPNCGADMRTPVETARDIVHEAIDNFVWSDTVDTAKMHKVVDDKYAEMTEDNGCQNT